MPQRNSIQNKEKPPLYTLNFQCNIPSFPLTSLTCKRMSLPGMSISEVRVGTPFADIKFSGEKIEYSTVALEFLVSSDLSNYIEVYRWLKALGYDKNYEQRDYLRKNDYFANEYSVDGVLSILSQSYTNPRFAIFTSMFPTSLSSLDFDATAGTTTPITCTVEFTYTLYDIRPGEGGPVI